MTLSDDIQVALQQQREWTVPPSSASSCCMHMYINTYIHTYTCRYTCMHLPVGYKSPAVRGADVTWIRLLIWWTVIGVVADRRTLLLPLLWQNTIQCLYLVVEFVVDLFVWLLSDCFFHIVLFNFYFYILF